VPGDSPRRAARPGRDPRGGRAGRFRGRALDLRAGTPLSGPAARGARIATPDAQGDRANDERARHPAVWRARPPSGRKKRVIRRWPKTRSLRGSGRRCLGWRRAWRCRPEIDRREDADQRETQGDQRGAAGQTGGMLAAPMPKKKHRHHSGTASGRRAHPAESKKAPKATKPPSESGQKLRIVPGRLVPIASTTSEK